MINPRILQVCADSYQFYRQPNRSRFEKSIMDMNLDHDKKHTLTSELNIVWQKLREKNYEDNDSEAYHLLGEFINMARIIGKSETHTDRLVKYTEELKAVIE